MNAKRVERIWRREGLKVPKRQPKRGRLWLNDGSCVRLRPRYRGHVWSYDFVADRTHDGKAFRMREFGETGRRIGGDGHRWFLLGVHEPIGDRPGGIGGLVWRHLSPLESMPFR